MAARIIDGKAVAAQVRAQAARDAAAFAAEHGRPPGLATILVGEDPASDIYVGGKQKACAEAGIRGFDHRLGADAGFDEVSELIRSLNGDAEVNGTLLQLPVPSHLDSDALVSLIHPDQDVDGLTPVSAGRLMTGRPGLRPCTPSGVIELLDHAGVDLQGARAVVIGRSILVGKPMAMLLLERNATVTVCHSRTRDLPAVCREADVLVAAAGQARMVKGDWVKPGAAVIDVGIHRTDDGLVGDVDFDAAAESAAWITPVPGGVGPMTIACLLRNTVLAAQAQAAGAMVGA